MYHTETDLFNHVYSINWQNVATNASQKINNAHVAPVASVYFPFESGNKRLLKADQPRRKSNVQKRESVRLENIHLPIRLVHTDQCKGAKNDGGVIKGVLYQFLTQQLSAIVTFLNTFKSIELFRAKTGHPRWDIMKPQTANFNDYY